MNETIAVGTLKALGPVLSVLVNTPWKRNSRHEIDNSPFKLKEIRIQTLVEEAKGVLDNGKGPNLKSLTNLATILTEGEIYWDIIKYISHRKFEENIKWDNLEKQLDELEKKLSSELDKHPESQSSGHEKEGESSGREKEGEMPGVRRRLLYLSRFPKKYVFNRQRISRLLVAYEFIAAGEPPLQHLANWLELVESNWDGAPNHFLIGNDVENRTPTWPQNYNLVREAITEKSIEKIKNVIFHSSLIFLGKRNYTLKLNKEQFLFLKVLSLRNGRLENESYLKELPLLKYLDLKNTENVFNCSWLEGLEELEMLDLRYTGVQKIPRNCLKKLGKLQHLLLGYRPDKNDNRLAGAKLDTKEELPTNLKTLRAIRRFREINVGLEVTDLSVTDLESGDLKKKRDQKSFWNVVEQFEKLTRLGVAVTKNSDITLQDCPAELKQKLERLQVEGLHSGLENLHGFVKLVDLTLASHQPIDIESIPNLPTLFCLRLYSCDKKKSQKTLKLTEQRFGRLKKVVIGGMAELKTVEIVSDVNETVDTLKLCNLPKLSELIYRNSNPQPVLLRRRESETVPPHRLSGTKVDKSIFLRGFEKICFDIRPGLKVYHYDINKQCYQLVPEMNPHDNQS